MDRRSLLKSVADTGFAGGLLKDTVNATIPVHNWDKYDWGPGPAVPRTDGSLTLRHNYKPDQPLV